MIHCIQNESIGILSLIEVANVVTKIGGQRFFRSNRLRYIALVEGNNNNCVWIKDVDTWLHTNTDSIPMTLVNRRQGEQWNCIGVVFYRMVRHAR